MSDTSYTGIEYADADDPASLVGITKKLADSARVVIPAASSTEMAQVVAAAQAAGFGPTALRPLIFYRSDEETIWRHNGTNQKRLTPKRSPSTLAAGRVVVTIPASPLPNRVGVTVDLTSWGFTETPYLTATVAAGGIGSVLDGKPIVSVAEAAGITTRAESASFFVIPTSEAGSAVSAYSIPV